jgi:hypothetical protein
MKPRLLDLNPPALFTIRRKPVLRPQWTAARHPYVPDDTGLACIHCALPIANQRHREPPKDAA